MYFTIVRSYNCNADFQYHHSHSPSLSPLSLPVTVLPVPAPKVPVGICQVPSVMLCQVPCNTLEHQNSRPPSLQVSVLPVSAPSVSQSPNLRSPISVPQVSVLPVSVPQGLPVPNPKVSQSPNSQVTSNTPGSPTLLLPSRPKNLYFHLHTQNSQSSLPEKLKRHEYISLSLD